MEQKIDEINDIMTVFLENVVSIAKIHTEYKEKLGEAHEMSKLSESLVHIFNQYQQIYVFVKDPTSFAKEITEASRLALHVFQFPIYELLEEGYFTKKRKIKEAKNEKQKAIQDLMDKINSINEIINQDMPKEEGSCERVD